MSLATKYRPAVFEDVCSQKAVVDVLKKQVETNTFANAYILCGASGCGKTTLARIMANMINKGAGNPIEIDAASNNGVDNIRAIMDDAKQRAVDSVYKIYIVDECHVLSNQAWQAALKGIEETPKYTIFFFCTTNPEKIPATIINRCMKFQLNRIPSNIICERLNYICKSEGYTNYEDTCDYISRICNGEMRLGISLLEKVSAYSTSLSTDMTLQILGNVSYGTMIDLINNLIDGNEGKVLGILNEVNDTGIDLRIWVNSFIQFVIDVQKVLLLNDINCTRLPVSLVEPIKGITNFDTAKDYYFYLLNNMLELKNMINKDVDPFSTIQIIMMKVSRCK